MAKRDKARIRVLLAEAKKLVDEASAVQSRGGHICIAMRHRGRTRKVFVSMSTNNRHAYQNARQTIRQTANKLTTQGET